eukprot:1006225_1
MSTVSLRPNATHHLRGKYTHTHSQTIIQIQIGKYNNFLSSFTETYHKELSSIYSLDIISLPESPMSNISTSSPISSYNSFSPNTSPYTSPYSQSNASKSGISPFDIVTRPNLKPSKSNHKKKKSNKSNNKSKKKKN